jgi:hypothetical protein
MHHKISSAIVVFCTVLAINHPTGISAQSFAFPARPAGFAVVELFTSEGCSSCPPADRVLEEIVRAARTSNAPIYALSFHVDYWNHLGWRDPYSKKEFSDRQRRYGTVFGSESIYTPQMIVSGSEEFVGSNSERAERGIKTALTHTSQAGIVLRVDSSHIGKLHCAYTVTGAWQGAVLNIALVQDMQPISVSAGENSGRKLSHTNVVCSFVSVPLANTRGELIVPYPNGVDVRRLGVIAYVQNGTTMKILSATKYSW